MKGALPPSSRLSLVICCAALAMRSRPISVDPVKLIFRTSGFEQNVSLISPALPVMQERMPGGIPASSARRQSAKAVSGVALAGLMIIGHPAARAGPALRVIMAAGKFHGVIAAVTPI